MEKLLSLADSGPQQSDSEIAPLGTAPPANAWTAPVTFPNGKLTPSSIFSLLAPGNERGSYAVTVTRPALRPPVSAAPASTGDFTPVQIKQFDAFPDALTEIRGE